MACGNTLREWKLACPKGDLGLVFPTDSGRIEHHKNILRDLEPVMIAAGLMVPVKDASGKPVRDKDGKPVVGAEIHRPSRPAPFLCVVVHQQARRWRT
jgi:hypothetical protein